MAGRCFLYTQPLNHSITQPHLLQEYGSGVSLAVLFDQNKIVSLGLLGQVESFWNRPEELPIWTRSISCPHRLKNRYAAWLPFWLELQGEHAIARVGAQGEVLELG